MYRMLAASAVLLLALLGLLEAATASGHHGNQAACEPGYTIVEEVVYQEVCRKVCKVVPEMKKTTKTVYSCKTKDYCLPRCPHLCGSLRGPGGCEAPACQDHCAQPRTKRLLVKKQVTEEKPSCKYVVEEVREVVPCKVYRKVPCAPAAPCHPAARNLTPR